MTVTAGESVLIQPGARVVGPVTVQPGGALTVVTAQISRGIVADNPSFLSICGSDVSAPSPATALSVSDAAVPIRIDDPANGGPANRFAGQVTLTSLGPWGVPATTPAPTNAGQANAAGAKTGQCSAL